jgi:hypothetical protein
LPFSPHLDGIDPVSVGTRTTLDFLAPTLFTHSTPVSMIPYRVTELCACDAPDAHAASDASPQQIALRNGNARPDNFDVELTDLLR